MKRHLIYRKDNHPAYFSDLSKLDDVYIQGKWIAGYCNICTNKTAFDIFDNNLRETVVCRICQSYNRQRQLVAVLAKELNIEGADLEDICKKLTNKKVLMLEATTTLYQFMQYFANKYNVELHCTEYMDSKSKSGDVIDGITHLDIQDPHYEEGIFDVVLHADVFEHVTDTPEAERQMYKLMKKGGVAVYTVPMDINLQEDDIHAIIEDGKIKKLKEAVYHGDPAPLNKSSRCLVFRILSYPQTRDRFIDLGADFGLHHLYDPSIGIIGSNAHVLAVKK